MSDFTIHRVCRLDPETFSVVGFGLKIYPFPLHSSFFLHVSDFTLLSFFLDMHFKNEESNYYIAAIFMAPNVNGRTHSATFKSPCKHFGMHYIGAIFMASKVNTKLQ